MVVKAFIHWLNNIIETLFITHWFFFILRVVFFFKCAVKRCKVSVFTLEMVEGLYKKLRLQ